MLFACTSGINIKLCPYHMHAHAIFTVLMTNPITSMKCHLADKQLTDILSHFANALDQPQHLSSVFGNKSNNKN